MAEAVLTGRGLAPRPPARLVVVCSGKGGTGKTFVASNLAVAWSLWGRRVVVVDADLGMANLHLALGVEPAAGLADLLHGRQRTNGARSDLLVSGPAGVRLLAGGSGTERLASPNRGQMRRLLQRMEPLLGEFDAVVLDISPGIAASTLLFLQSAEEIVLVSNPDPSAMLDGYALLKVLSRSPWPRRVHLVVNKGRDPLAARHWAQRIIETAKRFLDVDVHLLGVIPEDDAVHHALMLRTPAILNGPETPAAQALNTAARNLLSAEGRAADSAATFFSRSAELLAPRKRRSSK